MKGSIIFFWLVTLSLLLHISWELIQVKWVDSLQGKPWYIILRNCCVGITLDIFYTLGIYYLFAFFKGNQKWVLDASVQDYMVVFISEIKGKAHVLKSLTSVGLNCFIYDNLSLGIIR